MLNIQKIKGRMKELNWTQENLAKEMGINPGTLNYKINSENGQFLTIEEAEKLRDLLDIPQKELTEYFFIQKLEKTQEKEDEK